MKHAWMSFLSLFFALGLSSMLCADSQKSDFSLASPAFEDRGWIPQAHACDRLGDNLSPNYNGRILHQIPGALLSRA